MVYAYILLFDKGCVTNGWLYTEDITHDFIRTKCSCLFDFDFDGDLTATDKPLFTSPPKGRPPTSSEPLKKNCKISTAVLIPYGDFRFGLCDHFPEFDYKKHRCRFCSTGFTYVKCINVTYFSAY